MPNGAITNRDLYDAINDLRKEVSHKIEAVEEEVKRNSDFRNQLIGKITIVFMIIGIGVNFVFDWFREKLKG